MKNSFILIILGIIVAFIVIVSLAYIIILPYFVPSGLPYVSEQGRSYRLGNEAVSFQVIKIAHSLPRYHPLHQALSQDFATVLETSTDLKFIVEIYPEGSLGPDEQILKGTSRGTLEICLVREELYAENLDAVSGTVLLAEISSPVQYIWKIREKLTYNNDTVAVVYGDTVLDERFISLNLTPLKLSSDLLLKSVREGKAGFVVLDLLDWYYQDWNQWTASRYASGDPQAKYLMLGNAELIENLDAELHDALLRFAAHFGETASEMIRVSESEIAFYSGLNEE